MVNEVLYANRTCGTVHAKARRCVIIADNYSENRNYLVTGAYAAELVAAGWFDSVEMLFGPVGHTHNGVDAVHSVHNTRLLLTPCTYLGDLLEKFANSWFSTLLYSCNTLQSSVLCRKKPPAHCILGVLYNWQERYKKNTNKLAGINSRDSEGALIATGFKTERVTTRYTTAYQLVN